MEQTEKFILDTNLFFNTESGLNLGQKTEDVVIGLIRLISKLKQGKKADFFMPPKAIEEFLSFFTDKNQSFLQTFISLITIKSPNIQRITLPAGLFYELISDIRARSWRGLQIAEEEMEKAVLGFLPKKIDLKNKKDIQLNLGVYKRNLRERYRHATRFGFLDSVTDLELILLSLELDAYLVSTDEGVVNWGRKFAIKEMPAGLLVKHLDDLLRE